MLIAQRRLALLQGCLAAMDALWLAPLLMRLWPKAYSAGWWVLVGLLGALLLWMAFVDLAARLFRVPWAYRLVVLMAALLTCLGLWRVLLYPQFRFLDPSWLPLAIDRLPRTDAGPQPELVVLGISAFLWLRTVWTTGRDLTSLGVGRSFGWGALALLLTLGILGMGSDARPFYPLVPAYLGVGTLAALLALSDERAALAHTEGQPLPWRRLAQIAAVIALSSAVAYGLSSALLYPLQRALAAVEPLIEVAIIAVQLAVVTLVVVGAEVGRWAAGWLGINLEATSGSQAGSMSTLADELRRRLESTQGDDLLLAPWLLNLLRFLPLILVLLALALVSWLVLRRSQYQRQSDTAEGAGNASLNAGETVRQGLERLRDWIGMVRRLGVGRGLLAAISVQNIYANVCRIGAERGYPRPPSMSPDIYLGVLLQVFEGQEEALQRITSAYMRVHYGDQPVAVEELSQLQALYRAFRGSAQPQSRAT